MVSPEDWLQMIASKDWIGFLEHVDNWSNFRPLLFLALNLTSGKVLEFGSGYGSTEYLLEYCEEKGREFLSYDSDKEWSQSVGSTYIEDWDKADIWHKCGLAFIDHAPGEHRHVAIELLKDKADIICIHDSETGGAGDYKYEKVLPLFKYQLHYNRTGGGAGASLVSNVVDVSVFAGKELGGFKFDE